MSPAVGDVDNQRVASPYVVDMLGGDFDERSAPRAEQEDLEQPGGLFTVISYYTLLLPEIYHVLLFLSNGCILCNDVPIVITKVLPVI